MEAYYGSQILKPIIEAYYEKYEGGNFWGENFFQETNCYKKKEKFLGKKFFAKKISPCPATPPLTLIRAQCSIWAYVSL